MLEIGDAAHVAGRVPGVGALIGVFLQFAEVGRQELLVVALDGEVDAVGDEGRSVAEEVDVFVDLLDDFEGEFADEGAVGDEEDRNLFVAMADGAEDGERGALRRTGSRPRGPSRGGLRGSDGIGGDERQAILRRRGANDLVAFEPDGFD